MRPALRRLFAQGGPGRSLYWYGADGNVLEETDLSGKMKNEYVFFNGKRVARRENGPFISSLAIQNASLSQANALNISCSCGNFNTGPIPNWTSSGSGPTGSWQPSTSSFNAPLPGIIAYSNGGTISQTLNATVQPNSTYTLQVDVGHRLEGPGLVANYQIALDAGSTVLASAGGSNGNVPIGQFQTETLTYTARARRRREI